MTRHTTVLKKIELTGSLSYYVLRHEAFQANYLPLIYSSSKLRPHAMPPGSMFALLTRPHWIQAHWRLFYSDVVVKSKESSTYTKKYCQNRTVKDVGG
jgi:hypothetical protein